MIGRLILGGGIATVGGGMTTVGGGITPGGRTVGGGTPTTGSVPVMGTACTRPGLIRTGFGAGGATSTRGDWGGVLGD